MKMFFILGRNPNLSRAEILAFFKARNRNYREIFFRENFLVLELDDEERVDISEFGGVLKLGRLKFEGDNFDKFLEGGELVELDKFSYGIFGNVDSEILKNKFKIECKKAILKHGRRRMRLESGDYMEYAKADVYFFLYEFEDKIYFGIVEQNYDSEESEQRDMNKPVRRESLAISPRLAKILINLSGAKPGKLLLDPFCGVGGILQEALLKGIKSYGIDRDLDAIKGAEENLKWLENKYSIDVKYVLENKDSRKTPDLQFASVASESPLGVVLRKKPGDKLAKKIILDFEALIVPILKRIKRVKRSDAKIAISFPVVGKFRVDCNKVSEKADLRVIEGPFIESRRDQFVSRDIVVFT